MLKRTTQIISPIFTSPDRVKEQHGAPLSVNQESGRTTVREKPPRKSGSAVPKEAYLDRMNADKEQIRLVRNRSGCLLCCRDQLSFVR